MKSLPAFVCEFPCKEIRAHGELRYTHIPSWQKGRLWLHGTLGTRRAMLQKAWQWRQNLLKLSEIVVPVGILLWAPVQLLQSNYLQPCFVFSSSILSPHIQFCKCTSKWAVGIPELLWSCFQLHFCEDLNSWILFALLWAYVFPVTDNFAWMRFCGKLQMYILFWTAHRK